MRKPVGNFRLMLLPILAAIAALALSACGGDDGSSGGEAGPAPATATPEDAPLYLEVEVRPEGELEEGLDSALQKVTGEEDPGGLIQRELEEELVDEGLSYEEDIAPWLGPTAGLFLLDFETEGQGGSATASDGNAAAILSSTDDDAARAAIQKAADADDQEETDETYEGVDYQLDEEGNAIGIVNGFLIAGTEPAFQAAVDASAGSSLADVSEASEALDSAPDNSVFTAYADVDRVVDLAVASGAVSEQDLERAQPQLEQLQGAPLVLSGQATSDSFSLEATGPEGTEPSPTDIVSTLPSDAWLAFGVPMVGESIAAGFESFTETFQTSLEAGGLPPGTQVPDVGAEIENAIGIDLGEDLAWAGDMAVFASGASPLELGAGIVIDTDDEAAASQAVNKIRKRFAREPGVTVSQTSDGFQLSGIAGAPVGAEVAVRDGKLLAAIAGVTIDDLLDPSETLEQSASFSSAAEALDGLSPAFFLDFSTVLSLAESTGQTQNPDFQGAEPVLDALDFLVAGSGEGDGRSVGRLLLGLKEPSPDSGAAAAITP